MRILNRKMEEQIDHANWLTSFEKYTKTKQPKHLLPLYIYRSWDVEGKKAKFSKTDKMDEFKLEFEENFVEPRQSGEQKHVIYLQENVKVWIYGPIWKRGIMRLNKIIMGNL